MKKIFIHIITVLLAGMFFMGFSPSVDGRAVVADKDVLPAGLFCKTIGYLPGDSVNVINPVNGRSADILVLGSLDPSEGVAILLSPEAATELGIEKNANNLVKLTKRTGGMDEQVFGTATIARGEGEKIAETAEAEPFVSETVDAETVGEGETIFAPLETVEDVNIAEEDNEDIEVEEISTEEIPPVEKVLTEDVLLASSDTNVESEKVDDEVVNDIMPPSDISDSAVKADAVTVDGENNIVPVEEAVSDAEMPDTAKNDMLAAETAEPVPETAESSVEPVLEEPFIAEEIPPSVIAAEEPVNPDETPGSAVFEEPEVSVIVPEEDQGEVYAPIVLVPSTENPPDGKAPKPVEKDDYAENAFAKTPQEEAPFKDTDSKTATAPVSTEEFASYTVASLNDLKSGKYYVQISVLKEPENIRKLINTYKGNYPLVMVPLASGGANQMLVGPLERDEYNTVLAKFKANGFKDAFLRKIR
ncbi:hypothetical protein HRQ91_04805 [Treponema parvum]|uniref:SPOR domain-containing protein n=1 Tax=Treponema parvum TaxID=138851 RepID=A0A975F3Z4_9SPIR|nr:SPOR domain-containing protein [Treponema parvum]QTQ13833.1 hypothetical protein HRQ91_04805 [Treponema parvum]